MWIDALIVGIPIASYACVLWLGRHGERLVRRRARRP